MDFQLAALFAGGSHNAVKPACAIDGNFDSIKAHH